MPCATCGHTMQSLCDVPRRTFWCSRCGSLRFVDGGRVEDEAPKLVRYARSLVADLDRRIVRAAEAGESAPVFDGIGAVHAAVTPPAGTAPDA